MPLSLDQEEMSNTRDLDFMEEFLAAEQAKQLVRFSTAGSVDDGKSTLIGRLLYDSQNVYEDHVRAVTKAATATVAAAIDFAQLTDGLRAEREQGITIDVAYRYFSTAHRKFIIADTPGHEQYTRNMVTGASTADLTIILVDASRGILPQSRRHALIASLLGIRHVVVAINKMDLVGWSRERFVQLQREFQALNEQLNLEHLSFVPLSALMGDMVVARGDHLGWYDGPTLLELLENAPLDDTTGAELRFPVQLVSRPGLPGTYARGYMGRIEAGRIAVGERIVVQPSGQSARVAAIVTFDGHLESACAPQSVTLVLDSELDVSRGDLICTELAPARPVRQFDAMLCWMDAEPLDAGRKYIVQHTTRRAKAVIDTVDYVLDVGTLLPRRASAPLAMNEIGRVHLSTREPLMLDDYSESRSTGGFIVIDELSNRTVAAGMALAGAGDARFGASHG